MEENYLFQDKAPYPPVMVCGKNTEYAAAMLDNIGACNSEMTAVSRYIYNNMITQDAFSEIAQCFHKVSVVEMHHLNIFGRLSLLLGADPRLWHCQNGKMLYWSPECGQYSDRILILLENSLRGELDTIAKYMQQIEWIRDEYIVSLLKRIILDEELHVQLFKNLYKMVSGRDCCINRKS